MWSVSVFVFVGRLLSELDTYIHLERDIYTIWGICRKYRTGGGGRWCGVPRVVDRD